MECLIEPYCVIKSSNKQVQIHLVPNLNYVHVKDLPLYEPVPGDPDWAPDHGDEGADQQLAQQEVSQQGDRQPELRHAETPHTPAATLGHLLGYLAPGHIQHSR